MIESVTTYDEVDDDGITWTVRVLPPEYEKMIAKPVRINPRTPMERIVRGGSIEASHELI